MKKIKQVSIIGLAWLLLFFFGEGISLRAYAQTFQWAKQIGGTGYDKGISIAIDGAGNVYVTGTFEGTADFDPGAGTSNLTSAGNDEDTF